MTKAMLPRLAAAALLGLSLPASAHDLWLEREGSAVLLYQGHRHSSHAGQEIVPYDPAAVKEALCLDATGAARPLRPGATHPVRIEAACHMVLAAMSSGYWTKTAWETKNVPKTGISGVVKSWLSEETVKRLDRWTPFAAKPLSDRLEITPLADPLALSPGDKLSVRVSFAGKPLAGVPVAYDGDVRGATAADGSIALRLRHPGLQMISASFEAPLADGKADTVIRAATLNFELPR
jgi:nickel transport protein